MSFIITNYYNLYFVLEPSSVNSLRTLVANEELSASVLILVAVILLLTSLCYLIVIIVTVYRVDRR